MKKFLATVSTVAIMGAVLVGGNNVFAADSTATDIKGSTLSVTQPVVGNFNPITLNGQIQSTTASVEEFTVVDPTGTGAGWDVLMKATQFTDTTNNRTLPLNSLSIGIPNVTAAAGASDIATITTKDGTIDNDLGVKILSAAKDGGMGTYTVKPNTLTLNLLPKDVKAGNYTSTVTVTITTGP